MHIKWNLKRRVGAFTLLEVAYWCWYAAFLNYIASLLLEKGWSNGGVSTLLAGFMFMAFLGAFFWGQLSDRLHTNRRVLALEAVLTLALSTLIYAFSARKVVVSVLYPLLGFIALPMMTNIDAWVLAAFDNDARRYGTARSMGSLAFAIAALILGQLIAWAGYVIMLVGSLLSMGVILAVTLLLEDAAATRDSGAGFSLRDVKKLFATREYVWMIVLILLTGVSVSPSNNLKIVLLKDVGGDVGLLGVNSFLGVILQVPILAMSSRFRFIRLRVRFLMALALQFSMLLVTWLARSPWPIILGTCLSNLAYGLLLPAMRETVELNVPGELRNIGHNVADAVYTSLAGVLVLPFAGRAADAFGVKSMMLFCTCLMLVPLAIAALRVAEHER